MHWDDHGGGSLHHYALGLQRADRRKYWSDDVFNARLCLRAPQSRPARRNESRESNASAANVDGLPFAERFLFRLYFPARNHALDFLRPRSAFPDHLLHLAHARNHSPRRTFFGILAPSRHPHHYVDLAFHSLCSAVSEKDRLIIKNEKQEARDKAQ